MSNYDNDKIVEKVERIVQPIASSLGFNLVDIEFLQDGGYWYLRVYIEKENGEIGLNDCAELSYKISDDVDKVIEQKFFLEVSSPGVERPLKKIEDFKRFKGETIQVALKKKIEDSKNYLGELLDVINDDTILLDIGEKTLELPLKEIRKANIVFEFEDLD